jgi:transglycosylase-like protein
MRIRTLWPAAIVVAALAAPAGIALSATGRPASPALVSTSLRPPASSAGSASLRAPLAGHVTARSAMRSAGRGRVAREHLRLSRKYDALTGRHTARAAARRALRLRPARLRALNRELRSEVRELDIPIPAVLNRVAECESHNNPKAVGGGGSFRGLLQFMRSTWQGVGGKGDPVDAPREEQLRRGAILMARSGSSPWPVCGA